MKTIPLVLCAGLAVMPLQAGAPSAPSKGDVSAQVLAQCGVALLIVAVVGTGAYVIYKCNEVTKEKCHNCDTDVPADSDTCPACGTAYRCADCTTKLPEDAEKCPNCGTKVPDPAPVMNSLQMSSTGADWQTIVPPSTTAYAGVRVQAFRSEAEFQEWLWTQDGVTRVTPVAISPTSGFFRLARQ